MLIRQHCQQLDQNDPLAHLREEFVLPPDRINMDGNSLGSLPKKTLDDLQKVVQEEWGKGLITSWSAAGWFDAPHRVGDKIAPLIGAKKGEVLVADTTSINIFKALCAALHINADREILLSETGNFPTDLYMMEGVAAFSNQQIEVKKVQPEQVLKELNDKVAALLLTHVHYKTAEMKDMHRITQLAQKHGILVIWDLSHSAGSVKVDLNGANVDFAVGCGYKFLNGGPGAPGFIFVARRHQQQSLPVLSGWMGHQDPFGFSDDYQPADGMGRFRCGTPGILGIAALESGLSVFEKTKISDLRQKALQLSHLFIDLMAQECGHFGFRLASPLADNRRGGHISYQHPEGHGIYQAIKKRGVISDFRTPDILRFGITPLYLRFEDIYEVVQQIKTVMQNREWDKAEYRERAAIT